jgi:outer membrane protein insertion porin family
MSALRIIVYISCLFLSLLQFSCSTTKGLEPGEYLYKGSRVTFDSTASKETVKQVGTKLTSLFAPSPNRKILGLPMRLYWYNFFYTEKEKGLGHSIQNLFGEAPVLLDTEIAGKVDQLMENRLFNNGYFEPAVQIELDTNKQKAVVEYQIKPGPQYTIRSFAYEIGDTLIGQMISPYFRSSLIRLGDPYNLDVLKAERERITALLKNQGLYFFEADYLKFSADTTLGRHEVDLRMHLKENAPESDLSIDYIDEITVYTDYEIGRPLGTNSTYFNGLTLVYDELDMRPSRLRDVIFFDIGERYNPQKHQNTLRRLTNLDYYKFVSMRFDRSPKSDSLLSVKIFLTPKFLHAIEGSAGLALISNQYLGPELSLGYRNRNLFRGAEQFQIRASGNFNFPLRDDAGNYFEQIQLEASITRPGLGIPFVPTKALPSLIRANTRVQFGLDREKINLKLGSDPEFLDNLFFFGFDDLYNELEQDSTYAPSVSVDKYELSYGYIWQRQPSIQNELFPLRISFQNVRYGNEELKPLLQFVYSLSTEVSDEFLLNLERMLVFQPDYVFQYDSRKIALRRNNYFYRGRFSVAGNYIIKDDLTALDEGELENFITQFENDFRYFYMPRPKHTLAFRFITNVAYPFADKVIFPITDLYSVGGPNSIRAFYPRSLGPGTLDNRTTTQQFSSLQGKGDVKIESSLEYRYNVNKYIELALFADAGNVWRINKTAVDDETVFNFDTFVDQIALGTGAGLRIDLSYLVFRIDLAFPLIKPWLPEGERWVGNDIRLRDSDWRRENLVLNLAFGYPF